MAQWRACWAPQTSDSALFPPELNADRSGEGLQTHPLTARSQTGWDSMPDDLQSRILTCLTPPAHPVTGWGHPHDLRAFASASNSFRDSVRRHLSALRDESEARMLVFSESLTRAGPVQGPLVRCVLERTDKYIHLYMQGSEGGYGAHGRRLLTAKFQLLPVLGCMFVIGRNLRMKSRHVESEALAKVVIKPSISFSWKQNREAKYQIFTKAKEKEMQSAGVVTHRPTYPPQLFVELAKPEAKPEVKPEAPRNPDPDDKKIYLELGTSEVWIPQRGAPIGLGGTREFWSSQQASFLKRKANMLELYQDCDRDPTGEGASWKKLIDICEEGHDVALQVVKVGKDLFHLEYKAPMSALLAFSVALCNLNALQMKANRRLM